MDNLIQILVKKIDLGSEMLDTVQTRVEYRSRIVKSEMDSDQIQSKKMFYENGLKKKPDSILESISFSAQVRLQTYSP